MIFTRCKKLWQKLIDSFKYLLIYHLYISNKVLEFFNEIFNQYFKKKKNNYKYVQQSIIS